MNVAELAEHIGVKPKSVHAMLSKARKERIEGRGRPGLIPEPDEELSVGGHACPWWDDDTIARWKRPGRGKGGGPKRKTTEA